MKKRDLTDKILLIIGLSFFLLTVLYIVRKRIWLPRLKFSTSKTEKVSSKIPIEGLTFSTRIVKTEPTIFTESTTTITSKIIDSKKKTSISKSSQKIKTNTEKQFKINGIKIKTNKSTTILSTTTPTTTTPIATTTTTTKISTSSTISTTTTQDSNVKVNSELNMKESNTNTNTSTNSNDIKPSDKSVHSDPHLSTKVHSTPSIKSNSSSSSTTSDDLKKNTTKTKIVENTKTKTKTNININTKNHHGKNDEL